MKTLNLRWLKKIQTVDHPTFDTIGSPTTRVKRTVSHKLQFQTIEKITLPGGTESFIETEWTDIPTVTEDLDEQIRSEGYEDLRKL